MIWSAIEDARTLTTASRFPLGVITERVDKYKIRVKVFDSKDSWYHSTIAWDESHWEVVSESR